MFAWWGRMVYRFRYIVIGVMVALCLGGGVYGISLGELQRQHLDVLRERPGERPQLRHLLRHPLRRRQQDRLKRKLIKP